MKYIEMAVLGPKGYSVFIVWFDDNEHLMGVWDTVTRENLFVYGYIEE